MSDLSPPSVAKGTAVVLVCKYPDPTDYLPEDELLRLIEGCKASRPRKRRTFSGSS